MTQEIYDIGRTTHRPIPGIYEFIVENSRRYVDEIVANELIKQARQREKKGHSIPQELYSMMCDIWVVAYGNGDFVIDLEQVVYPDTFTRFQKVHNQGNRIGVLTSASLDFTKILFNHKYGDYPLIDLVDRFYFGSDIGDKNDPKTYEVLWEMSNGDISALFDDKLSVCKAANEALRHKIGIFLVDRKSTHGLIDIPGIEVIRSFDEV